MQSLISLRLHSPRSFRGLLVAIACTFLLSCSESGTGPDRPVATSIQLSHTTLTIDDGQSTSLTAFVLDQRGRLMANSEVTWSSANASVASVNEVGQVTGQKQGRTRITASVAQVSASLDVIVLPVAAVMLLPSGNQIDAITGVPLPFVVRILDRHGLGAGGVTVRFSAGSGGVSPEIVATDVQGYATTAWSLAPGAADQTATASVPGLPSVALTARATAASESVVSLLQVLPSFIEYWLAQLAADLPRNPNIATYFEAKMAMLRNPLLVGEIIRDRRWVEADGSTSGRSVPITGLFALEGMRAETAQSTQIVASGLPILEDFMGVPFPQTYIGILEGFVVGNSGGGGMLFMEDRATYETRTPPTRLPYTAILLHEMGHSYIGSESLTQFLELYQYNVLTTGSTAVTSWTFTRGWIPGLDTNAGVHALLDVYQLIGRDAMARAYRAVYPLNPPYGQPLSVEAQQAFVNEAPAMVQSQVAVKMAKILT